MQHTQLAKILDHISEWKSVGHFVLLGSGSLDDSGTLIPNSCKSRPQDVRRLLNQCKKNLGYSHWIARAFSVAPEQNMIALSYDTSLIPCYWHVFTQACREKDSHSVFSYSRKDLDYARYRWRRYGSFASITECNIESAEQIANYLSMPDPVIDGVFPRSGDGKFEALLFGRSVARSS
jgi:hypothetical protein